MKVVFLDRDETLNEDPGYLRDATQVRLLPSVGAGLRMMAGSGFQFIILTNQSGVGRGLIRPEELEAVNKRLCDLLGQEGVLILDLFFCPHTDEDACDCRKPLPGLLRQALARYPTIDLMNSWIIGDRFRDLVPGLSAVESGVGPGSSATPVLRGILVGAREESGDPPANLVFRAKDMLEAASLICGDQPVVNRKEDATSGPGI